VDQEESILLLFPDAPYEHKRNIISKKETNDHIAVWEGEKQQRTRSYWNKDSVLAARF
jgi:Xaa-Pro aminopeptidase